MYPYTQYVLRVHRCEYKNPNVETKDNLIIAQINIVSLMYKHNNNIMAVHLILLEIISADIPIIINTLNGGTSAMMPVNQTLEYH